jgi:hypothetical protein
MTDLLNPTDGLQNRAAATAGGFGYVERVSWFSEFNFPSFPTGNYTPAPHEVWISTLFDAFGGLSSIGETFAGLC